MKVFTLINLAMRYAPVIVATVGVVEGLLEAGTGKEKKQLTMSALKDVLEHAGIKLDKRALSALSMIIEATVRLLNWLGIFQHADERELEGEIGAEEAHQASAVAASETELRLEDLETR